MQIQPYDATHREMVTGDTRVPTERRARHAARDAE